MVNVENHIIYGIHTDPMGKVQDPGRPRGQKLGVSHRGGSSWLRWLSPWVPWVLPCAVLSWRWAGWQSCLLPITAPHFVYSTPQNGTIWMFNGRLNKNHVNQHFFINAQNLNGWCTIFSYLCMTQDDPFSGSVDRIYRRLGYATSLCSKMFQHWTDDPWNSVISQTSQPFSVFCFRRPMSGMQVPEHFRKVRRIFLLRQNLASPEKNRQTKTTLTPCVGLSSLISHMFTIKFAI